MKIKELIIALTIHLLIPLATNYIELVISTVGRNHITRAVNVISAAS
jgi:hypothetical protein